jgi:SAM-dependent methyltransferase
VGVAASWDEEYRAGRYAGDEPVPFVHDIITAVRKHRPPAGGIYIGCGNGRNFIPLVEAGIDLIGVDVSAAAIDQLHGRLPDARLVHGDLSAIEGSFGLVVGLQVFQHGSEDEAHAHVRAAIGRLLPGGLFCLRVNGVGTQIEHAHTPLERNTIRYEEGPKRGLLVHFFERDELDALTRELEPVLPLRVVRMLRRDDTHWDQWEAIWRCG